MKEAAEAVNYVNLREKTLKAKGRARERYSSRELSCGLQEQQGHKALDVSEQEAEV